MLALVEMPMTTDWTGKAEEIAAEIAQHAAAHDADDSFVAEGFAALEEAGFFTALVPDELGGGDAGHALTPDKGAASLAQTESHGP